MLSYGSNCSPSGGPIRLQQEGKFYRRLLSREVETGVGYYEDKGSGGVHGSVPFLWELEPGTPRDSISPAASAAASSLTSLSPPPAYYFIANGKAASAAPKAKKTKRAKKQKGSSRFRTAMAAMLTRFRLLKDEECELQFVGSASSSSLSPSASGFGRKSSSWWSPISSSKLDDKVEMRGGRRSSCLFCFCVGIEGVVA